jgi:hypothetical protein
MYIPKTRMVSSSMLLNNDIGPSVATLYAKSYYVLMYCLSSCQQCYYVLFHMLKISCYLLCSLHFRVDLAYQCACCVSETLRIQKPLIAKVATMHSI